MSSIILGVLKTAKIIDFKHNSKSKQDLKGYSNNENDCAMLPSSLYYVMSLGHWLFILQFSSSEDKEKKTLKKFLDFIIILVNKVFLLLFHFGKVPKINSWKLRKLVPTKFADCYPIAIYSCFSSYHHHLDFVKHL